MTDIQQFEPQQHNHLRVWQRLSEQARQQRLSDAQLKKYVLDMVKRRPAGESERAAIKNLVPLCSRANYRRWQQRYELYGFEGLVSWRMPPQEQMPEAVRVAICTLRRADPNIDVRKIVDHVRVHHGHQTSTTTVKRVLRQAGLQRRPGPVSGRSAGERRLELGGMKLVEAACVQTGYLNALVTGVVERVTEASAKAPQPVDTSDRDEYGRFLPSYNERFRRGDDDDLGPGYASIDQKRLSLDLTRLHVVGTSLSVVERKMLALMTSPLIGSGRWDGIRVARGELLEELCGVAYMPSTLDLFTRELKEVGVSNTLWEIHARLWLEQTRHWGDERSQAVLYIDGTNKPVWTHLFAESTKVTQVGRVMPGLESVCFHSGYGVPLWMVTSSGRAPLVTLVPELLPQVEQMLGGDEVGRIVVIDAESNSIRFLRALEREPLRRAWVTRLRDGWVRDKEIFNRSNYRPYRDGDRVRMGMVDFKDPEVKGETFRMRVVEVERRTKGTVTYLGASMLLPEQEWKPQDIADLYFERWPNQEASFRAVERAVGFKQVHGYGKQLVENISVVTELDKLKQNAQVLEQTIEHGLEELKQKESKRDEDERQLQRTLRRQETVARDLDAELQPGRPVTAKLRRLADERKKLDKELPRLRARSERSQKAVDEAAAKLERQMAKHEKNQKKQQLKESQRTIFKHDVELDSLFSVLKVGLVLLVTYVLKEFLGDACMEPVTFLERLATLPARLRMTPELEIVTFEYNRRDPDVMELLRRYCDDINARGLRMRSGRVLRVGVDEPPTPRLPPPEGKRTGTGDRFVKS